MGSKKSAGSRGASAANEFAELAINELRPFSEAGVAQLPGLAAGATAGGLDARLAELFNTDIFGSLVGERTRGIEGQLAAGGLTRSGTALDEIAQIGPDLALALESLLTGRSQGLAAQGAGAAGGIADLLTGQGQNVASGILSGGQAQAAGIGQAIDVATTAAGFFFSDRRLKTDAVQVSDIMGLAVYQWDWIPQTKGTLIEVCPTLGFMADEVRERYPDRVGEHCGWLFVDYTGVLDDLMAEVQEERRCLH